MKNRNMSLRFKINFVDARSLKARKLKIRKSTNSIGNKTE
jgi:hypothetical protein